MPQAGDGKREQDVEHPPPLRNPVASQWNINVIAKPGRERDVPPTPEFPETLCQIRSPEVLHQIESQ